MNRFVIPALLCLAAGTPALAQQAPSHHHGKQHHSSASPATPQWHEAYRDKTVTVSIDAAGTTKQSDGTSRAHLRWVYTADQPIGRGEAYRTMTEMLLLDCQGLRTKPISGETFDKRGEKVSSFDTPESDVASLDWLKRDPKSTGGKAIARVCRTVTKS